MYTKINSYQKAYNVAVEDLKKHSDVQGIFVFGSMVTGDLWKESDIDLLVIAELPDRKMKHIYCKVNGIDVHIRALGKSYFLDVYEKQVEGGYIHRLLCSSKMVYCNDNDILNIYDNCRLIPDIYREMWNMVFTGRIIKLIKETNKYVSKGNIYTAGPLIHKCIEEYSKLYVSMYGYVISKDVVNMATSLNSDLNHYLKVLYNGDGNILESIKEISNYIDGQVNKNIERVSYVMLEKLRNSPEPLSSEDIRRSDDFREYEINVEAILNRLYKLDIVKKDGRELFGIDGGIEEKVYYI